MRSSHTQFQHGDLVRAMEAVCFTTEAGRLVVNEIHA